MLLQNVYKTNVNEEEKLKDGHKVASAVKNSGLSKRLVVLDKLITWKSISLLTVSYISQNQIRECLIPFHHLRFSWDIYLKQAI